MVSVMVTTVSNKPHTKRTYVKVSKSSHLLQLKMLWCDGRKSRQKDDQINDGKTTCNTKKLLCFTKKDDQIKIVALTLSAIILMGQILPFKHVHT